MTDHEGDVLSIGPSEPRIGGGSARADMGERTAAEGDTLMLVEELRRHNADLERQNRELRLQQLELAASRDRWWDLWAHAPVGCVLLDADGRMLDANFAASVLLGAARPRLLGRALADWMSDPDAESLYRLRRAAVNTAAAECRVRLTRARGRDVSVTLRSVALRGEHGRTEWLTVLVDDE